MDYTACLAEVTRSHARSVWSMTESVDVVSSCAVGDRMQAAGRAADPKKNLPALGNPDDVI